jgi:cytochrome c-type biogenesis protein
MLPSFLALYLGSRDGPEVSLAVRAAHGFVTGTALTSGFASVFVVAGALVSIGLRSLVQMLPWTAMLIAAGLLTMGLLLLLGHHVSLTAASRVRLDGRPGRGQGRVVLFGAGYAFASLSCTLAVFLIVVSQAMATVDPMRLLAVFGAYVAGSATVLLSLSLSVALAKAAVTKVARWLAPFVSRLGGVLLLALGVDLVLAVLAAIGILLFMARREPPCTGAGSTARLTRNRDHTR